MGVVLTRELHIEECCLNVFPTGISKRVSSFLLYLLSQYEKHLIVIPLVVLLEDIATGS